MGVDLSTKYVGLDLKNPLVVAACSLTARCDNLRKMEEAGASAVVLPSLFEEQIMHEEVEIDKLQDFGTNSFAEALNFFPEPDDYRTGPNAYLDHVEEAKKAVSIPVVASLNGTSEGGWLRYAKLVEDAGADAIELNIYFVATDVETTGQDVEQRYLDLVAAVKQSVGIPLTVKVGPYFSSMGNMAVKLARAGADGLVLFNRFIQPDVELDEMVNVPKLILSSPYELLVPLRWIAVLSGRLGDVSLATTSGIHSAEGLLKAIATGTDVGMVASVLYRQGIGQLGTILSEMTTWLEEKEYASVAQLKGSMSQQNCPDPAAFERGNYMKALTSFTGEPI